MLKTLLSRVEQYKKYAFITPLLMIGEVAMEVLIPTLMAIIVDSGVSSGDMDSVFRIGILIILAAFLSLSFGMAGAWTASKASAGFAANIRRDLYGKIMDFSFADIDRFSTSSLITRMTTDVQNVQQSFQMMIRICFRAPVMFVFAIVMVYHNGRSLSTVLAVAIPIVTCLVFLVFRHSYSSFTAAFRGYDVFNRVVQENLNGIRTVKAYVREEQQQEIFNEATENIRRNFRHGQIIMALMNPLMMSVAYICMIIISYFGAHLINIGHMGTGELMSVYTYMGQILSSLVMTGMVIVMLSVSHASMVRIAEVLNTKPSMDINPDGVKEVKDGSVEFDHVSFGYGKTSKVLDDINLRFNSGEMIGIIGNTGSGKSTLISLIARLYDVTSGTVKVGGRDVREYNLQALRNEVSVVLQKNTLFTGTVAENLRWGNPDATDEEIKRACDVAAASPFVEAMKDGYKSHVEQGGTNFSGGQKQRLCIARALLKKPKILIMDDSTSAVDTATDASIRKALKEDVTDLTKIIISQRVSSVMDADQIVMLKNGRIDDIGTHSELLERNDDYRDLYETQTRGGNLDA